MKPWNGTCPSCGDTQAYQSFLDWECPNPACKKYTQTQDDLVEDAQDEIDLPVRKAIAPDYTPKSESEIDTVPYFPMDPYAGAPGLAAPDDDDDDGTVPCDDDDCDPADLDIQVTTVTSTSDKNDDVTDNKGKNNTGIPIEWDGFDGYGFGAGGFYGDK